MFESIYILINYNNIFQLLSSPLSRLPSNYQLMEAYIIIDELLNLWHEFCGKINFLCSDLEAWQVIFLSVGFTIISMVVWNFLFQSDESLTNRIKLSTFRLVRSIPYVKNKIQKEMDKSIKEFEHSFHKSTKGIPYLEQLPEKGLSEELLWKEFEKYQHLVEVNWAEGFCSGSVYSGGDKLSKLLAKVFEKTQWSNPLHPDVYPDIRKMELEVVRMTCSLFNGDTEACGTMTSGGSESLLLACYAYRNLAYTKGNKYPEIVLPKSAHAAFNKAANIFKIKLVIVKLDPVTMKVDMKAFKKAINSRTCMLVGSAPGFPHGVIDDIVQISELGLRKNIPVHVDCCLGGYLVPFMKKLGYPLSPFDFGLPGVTSISADTHKYGLAPKGTSVIMYRNKSFRQFQYFSMTDWPGGIYASPTLAGSRPGASIATCWATLVHTGMDGYIEATRKIIEATKKLEAGINKIDGLYAMEAETSVVVIGSKLFNAYRLSDAMNKKGWHLTPLQLPTCLHMCMTIVHTKSGVVDRILRDFEECTREIMKDLQAYAGSTAVMYGLAQSIPDTSILNEVTWAYFDAYYNSQVRNA